MVRLILKYSMNKQLTGEVSNRTFLMSFLCHIIQKFSYVTSESFPEDLFLTLRITLRNWNWLSGILHHLYCFGQAQTHPFCKESVLDRFTNVNLTLRFLYSQALSILYMATGLNHYFFQKLSLGYNSACN